MNRIIRAHDLLKLDPSRLQQALMLDDSADRNAMDEYLQTAPFVVVRRTLRRGKLIPVGIRGHERSQRIAAWCDPKDIAEIVSPESLRTSSNDRNLPAFHALQELEQRWSQLRYPWGPTGSAGFELATGVASVKETSDLDLVLRIDTPCPIAELNEITEATTGLPCAIDLQVETPYGAFALGEYLKEPRKLLLRTPDGPTLVLDPWQPSELRRYQTSESCSQFSDGTLT